MANETFESVRFQSWYDTFIKPYIKGGTLMPRVSKEEYMKQRVCARCGVPASEEIQLYPTKDGKFCRECLPMKAIITEGKTKHVFTDRAALDAYMRKEAWEQAYYELRNEERARIDSLLKPAAQTSTNLYQSERIWCRLNHKRVTNFMNGAPRIEVGTWTKYKIYNVLFRQYMIGWWQAAHKVWQKHWYYQTVWRFDPIKEKVFAQPNSPNFKWEQFYPLSNDPAISAAGIEIGARIEVNQTDSLIESRYVKGRVVFRRVQPLYACNEPMKKCGVITVNADCETKQCPHLGKGWISRHDEDRTVDCTHVAVMSGSLDTIPADQGETAKSGLDAPIVESVMSSEKNYGEVKLDPEEHYVALRSYVQGIAEVGLETMFASRYPDDPLSLPFGFNTLMQKQVLNCLKELCPNAAKSILYKAIGYILESAPDEWILSRRNLLDSTYGFTTILKEHDFWEMVDKDTQKRIVRLLGKLQPKGAMQFIIDDNENLVGIAEMDLDHHLQIPQDRREWFIYIGTVPLAVGIPVVRVDTTQVRSIRAGEIPYGHVAQFNGDRVEVVHHVPGVIDQHQADQRFRRELEGQFTPPELAVTWESPLQDQTPQIEGALRTMADAIHVPENVLQGVTAGTQEQAIRDQALVERYLLTVSAAVGMPIERFQNIIPQLLQLNDVRRAAVMVNTYYPHSVEIPSFDPRDF